MTESTVDFINPDWILLTFFGPPRHFVKLRKGSILGFWEVEGKRYVLIDSLGVREVVESLEYLEAMLDAKGI